MVQVRVKEREFLRLSSGSQGGNFPAGEEGASEGDVLQLLGNSSESTCLDEYDPVAYR